MNSDFLNLIQELKETRSSKSFTLEDVAKELGITSSSLSKIERGTQRLDTKTLIGLAKLYNISIDGLLHLNPNEKENKVSIVNKDFSDGFKKILKEYLSVKNKEFKGNSLGEFMRNEFPQLIRESMDLDEVTYKISGSVGQGQFSEIPWLAIYNRNITVSATRGYYIVYLFQADMKGFYLSLNQGWTYYKGKYGVKEGREKISKVAEYLRNQLDMIPNNLSLTEIDLHGENDLAAGYEAGHICGKYYKADSINSAELHEDLSSMLLTYKELTSFIGDREVEAFNDFLLHEDDGKFIEESTEASFDKRLEQEVNILKVERLKETLSDSKGTYTNLLNNESEEERPNPIKTKKGKTIWMRDARISAASLIKAKYQCAVDINHETFKSKTTGKPFMEAHHLIPMKLQDKMKYNLDTQSNIVCLCPTCHRLLHHGTDEQREAILKKLFYERRQALEDLKLEITFSDLKRAYNINLD